MSSNSTPAASLDQSLILDALKRLADGDLTAQLPTGQSGAAGEIAAVFNQHVDMLNHFAAEMTRITREIGTESKYGGQMEVSGAAGTWKDLLINFNLMSAHLTT